MWNQTNSFNAFTLSTTKSFSSPLSTPKTNSYHISSTLTPFFSNKLLQKNFKKKENIETIGCLRCTFLRFLMKLCHLEKNKLNKKTMRTQITTDYENDNKNTTFIYSKNEEDCEEKKSNIMEYIEESKEVTTSQFSVQPPKEIVVTKSISDLSSTSMIKKLSNDWKYPVNEMFLLNNEENDGLVLTKIHLENRKITKGRSFEDLNKLSNLNNEKESISFVSNPIFQSKYSRILQNFKDIDNKNLILDISSELSALLQVLIFINIGKKLKKSVKLQHNIYMYIYIICEKFRCILFYFMIVLYYKIK